MNQVTLRFDSTWNIYILVYVYQDKTCHWVPDWLHVDGLVENCSNSIANALELLQSSTKLSMYG